MFDETPSFNESEEVSNDVGLRADTFPGDVLYIL